MRRYNERSTGFAVTKKGEPIHELPTPREVVDPGISSSLSFASWEACVAAGLSLWKWEQGLYPRSFVARVLAWYKLHNLVKLHSEVEAAKAAKKKAKRK